MIFTEELAKRIRNPKAEALIMSPEEAASMIKDGMVLAICGFTPSGYPKLVPHELAERGKRGEKLKVDVYAGASLGAEIDTEMVEAGVIRKRLPFNNNKTMRKAINDGKVEFLDMHVSLSAQYINMGFLKRPDVTIVEALAITEDGDLVLTNAVGNTPTFLENSDTVIVEVAVKKPMALEGMHDIYTIPNPPSRQPIPLTNPGDRIGNPYAACGWEKIKAIVLSEAEDKTNPLTEPDETSKKISGHIMEFLRGEVKAGRLTNELLPLQSGVGAVANAVLQGFSNSEFHNLTCYTEVAQDSMLDLIREGKVKLASTTSVTMTPEGLKRFYEDIELFRDKIILRPQEISNHPEIIRRLGPISINTALEADIYGNVNSSHLMGKKMMNGVGGAGDFARNAAYSIMTTASTAKGGTISSIVPMCSHVDHTEHDVMVLVTEQGYADLRGLSPKERAQVIINNCAHPDYKPMLQDYFDRAVAESKCQTPHLLKEALSWHIRYEETGTMKF